MMPPMEVKRAAGTQAIVPPTTFTPGDSFKIAELLLRDKEDLVQKATGGWLRAAGGKKPARLFEFLDKYASTMPRTTLRYAIERLDKKRRTHYLSLAKL